MKIVRGIALGVALITGSLVAYTKPVSAAACTSQNGSVTHAVTVREPGSYSVWVRYSAELSATHLMQVEVDGTCKDMNLKPVPAGTWAWSNDVAGNAKYVQTFTAAKAYDVKLLADEGVRIDRVLLLKVGDICSDSTTMPSNLGDNCMTSPLVQAPSTPSAPTQENTQKQTVSGVVTLPQPEVNGEAVEQINYYIDGRFVGSGRPGEAVSVDTAAFANGTHKLTTEVVSKEGAVYTSDKEIAVDNASGLWAGLRRSAVKYRKPIQLLFYGVLGLAVWIGVFYGLRTWRKRRLVQAHGIDKAYEKTVPGYVPKHHYQYHAISIGVAVLLISGLAYAGIGGAAPTRYMMFEPEEGAIVDGTLKVETVTDGTAAKGRFVRFVSKIAGGGHNHNPTATPVPGSGAPTPVPTAGPTLAPTPMPTPQGGQLSPSQLPVGNPGTSAALITSGAPTGSPTPTWASAFRIECGYSHMNYDDAIVFPGQPGRTHLHTYFGNTGVNYASTYQSIKTTGNSTCSGGILNRSAYWVPSLMNGATPVAPTKAVVYYKSGYPSVPFATIQKLPDGLKMITGTSTASSSQNSPFHFIDWYCASTNQSQNTVPTCGAGGEVIMSIDFPQCWDGVNLDSPDHKSHMARPQSWSGAGCPTSHPVPLPHITVIMHWPVAAGTSAGWRLSSDMYANTIPGGYSAHADYMEGWDKDVKDTFVTQCLQAGKDCQVRWLGDGRSLRNVSGVN